MELSRQERWEVNQALRLCRAWERATCGFEGAAGKLCNFFATLWLSPDLITEHREESGAMDCSRNWQAISALLGVSTSQYQKCQAGSKGQQQQQRWEGNLFAMPRLASHPSGYSEQRV